MQGRLAVDGEDIMGLVQLMTANDLWEHGLGALQRQSRRAARSPPSRTGSTASTWRAGRRRMSRIITISATGSTISSSTPTANIAAPISPIQRNSLEQAQADKKAHIAAKLALKPGMTVLDIGCGWGGMALYLHEKTGAEVLGVTLSEEQLKVARRRAEEAASPTR